MLTWKTRWPEKRRYDLLCWAADSKVGAISLIAYWIAMHLVPVFVALEIVSLRWAFFDTRNALEGCAAALTVVFLDAIIIASLLHDRKRDKGLRLRRTKANADGAHLCR